jgi:hypothetical protein
MEDLDKFYYQIRGERLENEALEVETPTPENIMRPLLQHEEKEYREVIREEQIGRNLHENIKEKTIREQMKSEAEMREDYY